jgi:hypothetical protein
MSNKLPPLLFSLFLLLSCGEEIRYIDAPVEFSIVSPVQEWKYYDDTRITLAVNVNTRDVVWRSDIVGFLGEGNHLSIFLREGIHTVTAEIQNLKREVRVNVLPIIGGEGPRSILVNYSPFESKMKGGNYYPYLHTGEGSVSNFQITGGVPLQTTSSLRLRSGTESAESTGSVRGEIRLPVPARGKPVTNTPVSARAFAETLSDEPKTFFVINTKEQNGPAHKIEPAFFYQSDSFCILLPYWQWVNMSRGTLYLMHSFCQKIETTMIIPRVEALWGKPADIDGNRCVTIFLTSTINEEGLALGFFNPADFFERNNDINSEAYNPYSNEADILYVAFPSNLLGVDDEKNIYTEENIIATIAHELAHACTFTKKTWNRIKDGNSNAVREELFLDEGWSHLTENLCGLGVSGGNIKFLYEFYQNTSLYSFCGPNRINGMEDSAGMRGAISLFLSWLFWKSGGMSWDEADPLNLIDQGGISFLNKMVELPDTGWESIGKAYGSPTRLLFNEMLDEMNQYRKTGRSYIYRKHPISEEAVDFFVNMGVVGDFNIGFPVLSQVSSPNTLPPWSFVFCDSFSLPLTENFLTFQSGKNNGVFFSY